jgi:SNF2 family DNA or RNA helicase
VSQARQEIVDDFQAGDLDVIICSYGVGSTGLTLTRSHRVILLERPWTPGDARQAEDRVRRIGQTASTVTSYWLVAEGFTIDQSLDSLLKSKDATTDSVIQTKTGKGKINSTPL